MKIKLLFIVFVLSLNAYAQDKIYGKPEILKDKQVKILPIKKTALNQEYTNFYSDEAMASFYKGKLLIEPKLLENRVFNVLDVVKLPVSKYGQYYRIKIQDVTNNEILYYEYNENAHSLGEYYFEVVGGLTYPEGFYCSLVVEKVAGDGHKIYSSTKNYYGNFIDKKIDLKTKEEDYTLYISSSSIKTPPHKKGVVLTLENGCKINVPHSTVYFEKEQHSAILILGKEHVDMLSKSVIKNIEMGGLSFYTDKETFKYINEILKCMIQLKE